MPRLRTPCIDCGEPVKATRCDECAREADRHRIRKHAPKKASPKARGYDERWRRLSRRARLLQPFCSDCGATDDLQADHSPEAWERHEKGLPLRLADVDVVCGRCNRKRGAARGATSRSKQSEVRNGTRTHAEADRPSDGHTGPWGESPAGQEPDSSLAATLEAIDYPMLTYHSDRGML